jgi:hypothetical protein
MESEHIDNRKLYEVVVHQALLNKAEIEHLKSCEECLELIRVLVRQQMPGDKT